MTERRSRSRYVFPEAWVQWRPYHVSDGLAGGRIKSDAEGPQVVDILVDIASGGIGFSATLPPAAEDRILLNIFLGKDAEPLITHGVVTQVQAADEDGTSRVHVRFDEELSRDVTAQIRVFGDKPRVEDVDEADIIDPPSSDCIRA